MDPGAILAWPLAHPAASAAVILWLIANVAPRPHPESMKGYQKAFWTLVDRLCVLEAESLPGSFKWLFAASPTTPAVAAAAATAAVAAADNSSTTRTTDPPAAPPAAPDSPKTPDDGP